MEDRTKLALPPLAQPFSIDQALDQIQDAQPAAIDVGNGDSLDLLQVVYRNTAEPIGRRMRAAIAALFHERPKLAVTANLNGEAFGDALERAIKRSGKVIEAQAIRAVETPRQAESHP